MRRAPVFYFGGKWEDQSAGRSRRRQVLSMPMAPSGAVIRIASTATESTRAPQGRPIASGTRTDGGLYRGLGQVGDDAEEPLLPVQTGAGQSQQNAHRPDTEGQQDHHHGGFQPGDTQQHGSKQDIGQDLKAGRQEGHGAPPGVPPGAGRRDPAKAPP